MQAAIVNSQTLEEVARLEKVFLSVTLKQLSCVLVIFLFVVSLVFDWLPSPFFFYKNQNHICHTSLCYHL